MEGEKKSQTIWRDKHTRTKKQTLASKSKSYPDLITAIPARISNWPSALKWYTCLTLGSFIEDKAIFHLSASDSKTGLSLGSLGQRDTFSPQQYLVSMHRGPEARGSRDLLEVPKAFLPRSQISTVPFQLCVGRGQGERSGGSIQTWDSGRL